MNSAHVRERLQALPPDLPHAPDRFERVQDLVRRRRRQRIAGAAALLASVALAIPVMVHLVSSTDDARGTGPSGRESPAHSQRPAPGVDEVTRLSEPRVHDGAGTETVELGVRPAGATSLSTELTCLTAGRIRWPDGAAMSCDAADVPDTGRHVMELAQLEDGFVVRAPAGLQWRIRTTYVRVEPTDWGVNANGDTYGAANDRGEPDLLAVVATNGHRGYVYRDELEHASGGDVSTPAEALARQEAHGDETVSIPAYESDGVTIVGEFVVRPGRPVPQSPPSR
jgi:hypothetical protein